MLLTMVIFLMINLLKVSSLCSNSGSFTPPSDLHVGDVQEILVSDANNGGFVFDHFIPGTLNLNCGVSYSIVSLDVNLAYTSE